MRCCTSEAIMVVSPPGGSYLRWEAMIPGALRAPGRSGVQPVFDGETGKSVEIAIRGEQNKPQLPGESRQHDVHLRTDAAPLAELMVDVSIEACGLLIESPDPQSRKEPRESLAIRGGVPNLTGADFKLTEGRNASSNVGSSLLHPENPLAHRGTRLDGCS